MSGNYRKLGDYIQPVDVRNSDLKVSHLLGVSVEKRFIESIANTIGTDFSKYKIVKKGQFTYIPDTSRRGDKIGIALLTDFDEGLVSNIYTVFEVIDKTKLLPEYLMLWFRRPEFDRYARYKSHGSVRELFDWDEMCRVELPVPELKEQQKIVNTYSAITKRIQLKQKINENLKKTANVIYLNIFNNLNSNDIIKTTVERFCPFTRGKNITASEMIDGPYNVISAGLLPAGKHVQYNVKGPSITISGSGVNAGYISFHIDNIWAADCSYSNSPQYIYTYYVILKLLQDRFFEMQKGTAQPHVFPKEINPFEVELPKESIISKIEPKLKIIYETINQNQKEIINLRNLRNLLIKQISKR